MDAHDREFLNKQMHGPGLPRRGGTIVLTVVATFLAGTAVGGILFDRSEPTRTASNYVSDNFSFPIAPPLITR
jgi:hypothetical protein